MVPCAKAGPIFTKLDDSAKARRITRNLCVQALQSYKVSGKGNGRS